MKRSVTYIRFFLPILLFITISVMLTSCKEDPYLDEPTTEGLNTHSFKVNSNEFVRYYLRLQTSPLRVSGNQLEAFFISKIHGRDVRRPIGDLLFRIISLKADPDGYELDDYTNNMYFNRDFNDADSTKCFFRLSYYKDEETSGAEAMFTNVLSGEFRITRQDTIVSGTFNAVITNGTDTLTITEGKFDYNINYTF
jgi:hypothetical protein